MLETESRADIVTFELVEESDFTVSTCLKPYHTHILRNKSNSSVVYVHMKGVNVPQL